MFIKNSNIVTADKVITNAVLVIEDAKIAGITQTIEIPEAADVIDADGGYVVPGFIDIHIHGGGGYDFMDGTLEGFNSIGDIHCKHGTTSMVPTTVACTEKELFSLFPIFRKAVANSKTVQFLGMHLEGPFISFEMKGAQRADCIITPSDYIVDKILDYAGDIVIRCSGAPEIEGMKKVGKKMVDRGILMAVAHSNATCEQILEAYDYGFSHITHLYCSTPSVRKVNQKVHAGVVEAAYLLDDMTVEIIGDGVHIPKELMQMVVKFKGAGKTVIISDAMRAAGTNATESYLGSGASKNPVIIEGCVAKLPDRSSFAGSVATSDAIFRNAVLLNGLSIIDVCKMMSLTPAKIIGVDSRKGSIKKGKDADIVVMNKKLEVEKVFVKGKIVFNNIASNSH
mgnify:CR=1 FL=1